MRFVPKEDQLLVKRQDAESVTKGGLFIPDTGKEAPAQGVVISVGPKVEDTKVDEKVLFGKYAGTEIELDGTKFLIMREEEILGSLAETTDAVKILKKKAAK